MTEGAKQPCPACGANLAGDPDFCTRCGARLGPDPLCGRVLDERYEVIRHIGGGAMGTVYEVRHLRLGKRFAMKIIRPAISCQPEFAARFEQEAMSCSRLNHPHCIAVTDYGQTADGLLYLVMEYLEGETLGTLLGQPVPVSQALVIARQILLALAQAHRSGVVHRDIKPDNVLLVPGPDQQPMVKVVDFGIAKLGIGDARPPARLTDVGMIFGTPEYMAPEQALSSADVDERADIYAVGVILWILLTGRPPFSARSSVELLRVKISSEAPRLDRACPGVFAPQLVAATRRALATRPEDRYPSAQAFADDIAAIAEAQGGGLSTRKLGFGHKLMRIAATVGGQFGHWYRCSPHRRSIWGGRLVGLLTTAAGRTVLSLTVVVLALLAVLLAQLGGHAPARSPASPDAQGAFAAAPWAAALGQARQHLSNGACRQASLTLQTLTKRHPKLAAAHYLMGRSLACQGYYAGAIKAYTAALALDRELSRDKQIVADARLALGSRHEKTRLAALRFLESDLGSAGLPPLLEATQNRARKIRQLARTAAVRLGAGDKIDWLHSLRLDLRQLPCRQIKRRRIVEQIRDLNDPRAIPTLRWARDARSGLFRRRYRYGCVRQQLISSIEHLLHHKKNPQPRS